MNVCPATNCAFAPGGFALLCQDIPMRHLLLAAAFLGIALTATSATAQADSHYSQGPLWFISGIHIEDGQYENYMDYLAKQFKTTNDFVIKEGVVLSYHVLSNNQKRAGEPDLLLVITSKDYLTVAQQEAYELKLNKMLSEDRRGFDAASAKRAPMRKLGNNMEFRELILK